MRRSIAILAASTMTLLGLAGGSAGAVVSGANGRIVFACCIVPFKCLGRAAPPCGRS